MKWWLSFPVALRFVAVISWRPLDGCPHFPGAVGHTGTVQAKGAKTTPRKMASVLRIPRHNLAHFHCAKLRRSQFCLLLSCPSTGTAAALLPYTSGAACAHAFCLDSVLRAASVTSMECTIFPPRRTILV